MTPNPALQTNTMHTYLATGCRHVGDLQMDPGEDIEVVLVPRTEVPDFVRRGEIDHGLVLAGLYFASLA
jgi:ATP phosphoribosyltransferase